MKIKIFSKKKRGGGGLSRHCRDLTPQLLMRLIMPPLTYLAPGYFTLERDITSSVQYVKSHNKIFDKVGTRTGCLQERGWTFWRLGGVPIILMTKLSCQAVLKFMFIRFSKFISNLSVMFHQGSVLFTMSASVLAGLLNHQLCETRLKQAVNASRTPRFWSVQELPKMAEVWLNFQRFPGNR